MAMREKRERGRKLPQVKPKKNGGGRIREKEIGKKEKEKKRQKGKAKREKKKRRGRVRDMGKGEKRERHFPSRSPKNRQSKRWSTRRELCMSTRNRGFRRVPKSRGFSYTGYFLPSGHIRAILVKL